MKICRQKLLPVISLMMSLCSKIDLKAIQLLSLMIMFLMMALKNGLTFVKQLTVWKKGRDFHFLFVQITVLLIVILICGRNYDFRSMQIVTCIIFKIASQSSTAGKMKISPAPNLKAMAICFYEFFFSLIKILINSNFSMYFSCHNMPLLFIMKFYMLYWTKTIMPKMRLFTLNFVTLSRICIKLF